MEMDLIIRYWKIVIDIEINIKNKIIQINKIININIQVQIVIN